MEKSKVAVVACPDYEPARVKESLQKGLEAIGGLESLIGKEENILLKHFMLVIRRYELDLWSSFFG